MDFPKNEAQALLDWMREKMYGDTVIGGVSEFICITSVQCMRAAAQKRSKVRGLLY